MTGYAGPLPLGDPGRPRGRRHRASLPIRLLLALTAACAASFPLAAHAATSPTPTPVAPPVFGVQAGNFGKTTLRGGHYSYAVNPGDSITDSVIITNYSDHTITVQAYPADLVQASGGGVSPAQGGATMTGVGLWAKMVAPQVDIPAQGKYEDKFTLAVPANLLPGTYPGAIVVSYSGGASTDSGESIITRAALIIELNLPGTVTVNPVLGALQVTRVDGTVKFSYDVTNAGNVLFTVIPDVAVRDSGGQSIATIALTPSDIYVIPGGHATVSGTWTGVPSQGTVTAGPHAQVILSNKSVSTVSGDTVSLCFFPWRLWIPVALAVLVVLAAAYLTRGRWRTRWERRRVARRMVSEILERGITP